MYLEGRPWPGGFGATGQLVLRDSEITGGNADGYENKGVEKKAIQKMLKTKE
jgi:hypothetical protein